MPMDNQLVKLLKRPARGPGEWSVHMVKQNKLGDALLSGTLDAMPVSQAVNMNDCSIYRGIVPSVVAIAAALDGAQSAIDRSFSPTLVVPDGTDERDVDGIHQPDAHRRRAAEKGAVLSMSEEGVAPEYLTLEADTRLLELLVNRAEDAIALSTGVTRQMLSADGGRGQGVLSGIAMRRQMVLFTARLARLQETNRQAIVSLLAMLQTMGAPMFEAADVMVTYPSIDALFSDEETPLLSGDE